MLATIGTELPGVALTGVDDDPVLVELGRRNLGRFGRRATLLDTRIGPGWATRIDAPGPFDAVVAMLVLHYFDGSTWRDILDEIRTVLRPGGLLAVIDVTDDADGEASHVAVDHAGPTWAQWWQLAASLRGRAWADAFEARAARPTSPSAEHHPTIAELVALLERTGFTEIGVSGRIGPAYLAVARTAHRSERPANGR